MFRAHSWFFGIGLLQNFGQISIIKTMNLAYIYTIYVQNWKQFLKGFILVIIFTEVLRVSE